MTQVTIALALARVCRLICPRTHACIPGFDVQTSSANTFAITSLHLCPQHSVTAILFNVPLWIYVCRVGPSEDTEREAEGENDVQNADDDNARDGDGDGDNGSAAKKDGNKASATQPSGPELLSWVLQQIEHIVACHRDFIRATVPDATWTLLSSVSLVDNREGTEV